MWFKLLGSKGYYEICMKEENCFRYFDGGMWGLVNYIIKCCLLLVLLGYF